MPFFAVSDQNAGFALSLIHNLCNKIRFPCVAAQIISSEYHAVLTLMAVSFIAKFSFPCGCFVFYIKQLKVKFAYHYAIQKRTPNKFIADSALF